MNGWRLRGAPAVAHRQPDPKAGGHMRNPQPETAYARLLRAVLALRVLTVLPKQRLESPLVFFIVLKSVDVHGVVDN